MLHGLRKKPPEIFESHVHWNNFHLFYQMHQILDPNRLQNIHKKFSRMGR